MSDDIVERLRSGWHRKDTSGRVAHEAADEIERLRAWIDLASMVLVHDHSSQCVPPPDQSLEDWCTTCFLLVTASNGGHPKRV